MVNTFHQVKEFLSYQHKAQTKYYIHSPFVYQFYLHVLDGGASPETNNINRLRKSLLQRYDKITMQDMGAAPGTKEKSISTLAARSSMTDKYGMVLLRLIRYFSPQVIIELGTCLGIGTAYMAEAAPAAVIVTIEGSSSLTELAIQNHKQLGLNNIEHVTGSFDERLPAVLAGIKKLDLAFIDGHHRYEPTLRYFNLLMEKSNDQTILIFDDIYWSAEMTAAWTEIKKDPRITLTIDIYRFGIAFMRIDKLAKEDFVLRY